MTFGEMETKILAILPKAKLGTPAQWAAALALISDTRGIVGPVAKAKNNASRASNLASDVWRRATETISQCAAPPPDNTSEIKRQIAGLERQIAGRDEVFQAEARAAEIRRQLEMLRAGTINPVLLGFTRSTTAEEDCKTLRQRIDRLMDLASTRPTAEAANERDQAKLADLQARLTAAVEANNAYMANPDNMRWIGD
jgi:hypothetical protein